MTQDFTEGDFFVMLNTQRGSYTPLMDSHNDDIAKFITVEAACECADANMLGEHFGYEVFEIGCGV